MAKNCIVFLELPLTNFKRFKDFDKQMCKLVRMQENRV